MRKRRRRRMQPNVLSRELRARKSDGGKCISGGPIGVLAQGLCGRKEGRSRCFARPRSIQTIGGKLNRMALRPFPEKSGYHSQEFIGAPITHQDQGYLVAYIDGGARGNPGPAGYGV